MAPINKIANHKDRELIIEWLVNGVSVRDVAERLRKRYPKKREAHLRVSVTTLQNFRTGHLNLKGQLIADINEANRLTDKLTRVRSVQDKVADTDAYQKKINEIAQDELNIKKEMIKAFTLIETRLEFFYNRIHAGDFPDIKEEKVFQGYLDQGMRLFEQYKKYIDGHKDVTEHNVNINIMTDQMNLIRDAVRETLADVEPELSVTFMDKLNEKMRVLMYRADGHHVGLGILQGEMVNTDA